MDFFDFEGKKVYYEIIGNGRPLLLLHGNSVSSSLFISCKNYFSQYFKVILMDYPGHGKSERLDKFRDDFWRYNAEAAFQLMDLLNIENFDVIGTSGGAMVGLNMCIMQPDRIGKIIADSFFGDYLTYKEAEKIVLGRRKAKNDFMTTQYWKFHNGEDWEQVVDNDCEMMLSFTRKGFPTIFGDLSVIKAGVLLVATSTDELLPNILERLDELSQKIPICKKAFYDYGRHTFMITEKEEFRKIAMDFLKN
ncbi:MAG: alpha/beta hydrolase [Candidatus Kapabacteria bacterium]|nr:alpha/beta hydrolase [Ignavibacteriota bacterium]MCW5884345.1 alpha/beta hydrolase [Candidatus Kapabacteria bacterium]